MKLVIHGLLIATTLGFASQVSAQYNRQRGAVLGGLTGAAAGAIIGENSNEPGAGAAIGGLVGAVAGTILGTAQDQQVRDYRVAQQRQVIHQQRFAVSLQDVVAMSRNRVSDAVMITEIQHKGVQRRLEVADIVYLSQNGVSDAVIRSMQQAGTGYPVVRQPVVVSRPQPVYYQYHPTPPRYYGHGHHFGRPVVRGSIFVH